MLNEIQLKSISKIQVTSLKKQCTYEELKSNTTHFHKLANNSACGIIIYLGHNKCYDSKDCFEVCFPTTKINSKTDDEYETKILNSTKAICGTFQCKYDDIHKSLEKLGLFALENGLITTLPYRIIYMNKTILCNNLFNNFSKCIIEIQLPIQPEYKK